jgi:hypothetical protein
MSTGQLVRPADNGMDIALPDGTLWTPPPHPLSGRLQPAEELIPRVCMIPEFAFSSGPEAIELAASAGLILDPWEQLAVILGLGETARGKWAAFMVALIVARQNGKGAILEALGLYWLFGTGESLIGHTAHEYKTAMEAFRRILALIQNTDWMRKKVKKVINTNGEEGVELLPQPVIISGYGSQASNQMEARRLRFLARSKGAGRGFTFKKLIWDEAYALTEEQQEAQLPTLSAVPNGQVWVTSSPPLTSDTGRPLFALRRNAKQGGDVAFMDYGAEGSLENLIQTDLDNRVEWLKRNPNAPERIAEEAIARERVAMSDRGFARERLGIWPPDLEEGFLVISAKQWSAMTDLRSGNPEWDLTDPRFPRPDMPITALVHMQAPYHALTGRPAVCVDVSPRIGGRATASIGLAQARQDGKRHLELVKYGAGSEWTIPDLVTLHVKRRAVIVIDPGSPAGSLLADLQRALREHYKDPAKDLTGIILTMATRDVAQAFGMIYDAATRPVSEERTVVHRGQEELELAVGGADKRKVGEGHAWDRSNPAVDITGLIGVTNALWGLANLPEDPDDDMPMVMWA